MSEQMNMLGDAAQPIDDQLGLAQRAVMRKLRRLGSLAFAEVGAVAHAGRGKHPVDDICMWCSADGEPIARALVRRGLAEAMTGGVRLPKAPTAPQEGPRDDDPFPEGF